MSIPTARVNGNQGVSSGQRLNKKPAIIVAALVAGTLFGVYYAAIQRSTPQQRNAEQGQEMLDIDAVPEMRIEFLHDRPDGLAGVDSSLFDQPSETSSKKARVSTIDDQMMDAYEAQQIRKLQQDSALREQMLSRQIEQARAAIEGETEVAGFGRGSAFYQERIELDNKRMTEIPAAAFSSPVNVQPPIPTTTAMSSARLSQSQPANASVEAIAAQLPAQYQAVFRQVVASQTAQQTQSPPVNAPRTVNATSGDRDFTLRNKLESPRTRFEIKTGSILPAAMISAANSDLPGDIVGQITQNIYDTQTGKYLLIPQGTKLFGRYDAYTALGQERLLIVWDRLIFPDAQTLDIGGMQGYDGRGLSGAKDQVITHFFKTLANAFLISTVDAAGQAVADQATQHIDNSFVLNLASGFGDVASKPFDDYLRSRLRIKPTLSIRAGYRFYVMVSKDISLDAPYRYGYTTNPVESP